MNRIKRREEIKELIKRGRITTEEKIYKGKRYQMINCGGKYLNIGVCVDDDRDLIKNEK